MNIVIITGASSGIGMEFAFQMDEAFNSIDQFWLIARNRERLEEVASVLHHPVMILDMDLQDPSAIEELELELKKHRACVRMLINCAGYGVMGDFASQNPDRELGMIKLNCEALTNITHKVIPYMKRGSRIIQLASSAAFLPQPDFAVYAATKSYVLSFSRALGEELRSKGIYVTAVCPGPVNTPFFDKAEKTGTTLKIKKYFTAHVEDVVAKSLKDSYYKRTMSVYSLSIKCFEGIAKYVPHQLMLDSMRLLNQWEIIVQQRGGMVK